MKNISNNEQRGQNFDAAPQNNTPLGYFTKSEFKKPGIYKNPDGYTPYAWRGSNCPDDRFMSVKEVAQRAREYIKNVSALDACKWSITTQTYSGGQSITVALMAAPFEAFKTAAARESGYAHNIAKREEITPEALKVVTMVKEFVMSFNYDDSDGMIDYFDRGFYGNFYIGKFGKPFRKIEARRVAQPKNAAKAAPAAEAARDGSAPAVELVDYSAKAVAVVGDTRQMREVLRQLGGRFNAHLTCGPGWIFSKKKADGVRAALSL